MRLESEEIRKDANGTNINVTVYLELGIDELGYWQELEVYNGQASIQKEERIYPKAMGKNLTYIPVEVVQTERKLAGKLQIEGGYLAPLLRQVSFLPFL